jgi:hypothetical protein
VGIDYGNEEDKEWVWFFVAGSTASRRQWLREVMVRPGFINGNGRLRGRWWWRLSLGLFQAGKIKEKGCCSLVYGNVPHTSPVAWVRILCEFKKKKNGKVTGFMG